MVFFQVPSGAHQQLQVTALQLFPAYMVGHEEWQRRTLTLLFWDSLLISSGYIFFSSPMFRPGYRSLPACAAAPPVHDSGARSVSQVSL